MNTATRSRICVSFNLFPSRQNRSAAFFDETGQKVVRDGGDVSVRKNVNGTTGRPLKDRCISDFKERIADTNLTMRSMYAPSTVLRFIPSRTCM